MDEDTQAQLGKSAAERIAWFQTEFWIDYAVARAILADLEDLVIKPRRARMAGYVVTADSNNGKTMLARRFLKSHPQTFCEETDAPKIPVLYLEVPSAPTDNTLLDAFLDALGIPYKPKDPPSEKRRWLLQDLRRIDLRVVLLDELQRLLGAKQEMRRILMDLLRQIANAVPVPLVAFSTPRGTGALASSDEMINRMRPRPLPPWRLDKHFQALLTAFERRICLPVPSRLGSKELAPLIHAKTEGYIGEVYDLLEVAVRHAVNAGESSITVKTVQELGWVEPAARKRHVKSNST